MNYDTTGHILWPHDEPVGSHTCDHCHKLVHEVTQTKESEWVCRDCLADLICEECGVISADVTRILISCGELSDLVDLCPECREALE